MDKYAQRSTERGGRIHLIELADGGMLKLATLARDTTTWHLSFKVLVLVALDIENSGRSAFLGERQPSRYEPDLQLYLGRRTYDPAENIEVVEWSCNDDVRRWFLTSKLTTSLSGQVTRWKTDEQTRGLRVPVILSLGGCCRAFDLPRHISLTYDNIEERFMRHFRELVVHHHDYQNADPKPLALERLCDGIIHIEANGVKLRTLL